MSKILNRKTAFIAALVTLFALSIYQVLDKDGFFAKNIIFCIFCINMLFLFICYFSFKKNIFSTSSFFDNKTSTNLFIAVMAAALAIRIILCLKTKGFESDMWCFVGWSQYAANNGFATFYTGQGFADYPPGYIYIIAALAKLINFLKIDPYMPLGLTILAVPTILCDIGIAFLGYKLAKKHSNQFAFFVGSCLAFLPTLLFDSAVWKQVDSVFVLVALIAIYLLINKRYYLSCFVYAAAILIKPQALILGPVYAIAFLQPILEKLEKPLKIILRTVICGAISLGTIFICALPFQGTQQGLWLLDKYFGTMKSYPYASVNAANIFTMLGENYCELTNKIGFFTTTQISSFFLAVLIVAIVLFTLFSTKRKKFDIVLLASFFIIGVFTLCEAMHERYSVVGTVLLFFAFINSKDIRLFIAGALQASLSFFNIICVYFSIYNGDAATKFSFGGTIEFAGFLQVATFIYVIYICLDTFTPIIDKIRTSNYQKYTLPLLVNDKKAQPLKWTKTDTIFLVIPVLVAMVISYANLGDMRTPVTTTDLTQKTYSVWFKDGKQPYQALVFGEISNGTITFSDTATKTDLASMEMGHTSAFNWNTISFTNKSTQIDITGENAKINEIIFLDENGIYLRPQGNSENAINMFDEQYLEPDHRYYKNGMYFDEIYHARTAYEQQNGLPIYETTHPPFGKVLIEIGISIFGMNPFGWRFMGTLLGVMLVGLMYILARKMFNCRKIALFCQLILLFDCMRFAQSRIATIDTPTVFFIMLSYLFMLYFIDKDFNSDTPKNYLVPLFLCGLSFGFGCATKWTGIYSGAGLAIIFFMHLYKAYRQNDNKKVFLKRFAITIACATLFFVLIPIVIYVLSYIPVYINSSTPFSLKLVWDNQTSMLSYHSQLSATHSYGSAWWSWPLSLRPVWYSVGGGFADNIVSTISVMGNPFSWILALLSVFVMFFAKLNKSKSNTATFLLIAMAAQFIPWVFVTRVTFLYHYFTCLPFVILALGWVIAQYKNSGANVAKYAKTITIVTAVVFCMFYPVISGMPVYENYVKFLEWLPSWTFLGW